jgi:hypothetical protein
MIAATWCVVICDTLGNWDGVEINDLRGQRRGLRAAQSRNENEQLFVSKFIARFQLMNWCPNILDH